MTSELLIAMTLHRCSVNSCNEKPSIVCCGCLVTLCAKHAVPTNRCEACGTPRICIALFDRLFQDRTTMVLDSAPTTPMELMKEEDNPICTILESRSLRMRWSCARCYLTYISFYEFLRHVADHTGQSIERE